jgi:hypothetical protein
MSRAGRKMCSKSVGSQRVSLLHFFCPQINCYGFRKVRLYGLKCKQQPYQWSLHSGQSKNMLRG